MTTGCRNENCNCCQYYFVMNMFVCMLLSKSICFLPSFIFLPHSLNCVSFMLQYLSYRIPKRRVIITQGLCILFQEKDSIVHRIDVSCEKKVWLWYCLYLEIKYGLRRYVLVPGWQGVTVMFKFYLSTWLGYGTQLFS